MKNIFKIFIYLIITPLLIFCCLLITVSLTQNKIVDMALSKISKTLDAPIEVEDVSFTLFKKFPYSTFELSGIRVGQQNLPTKDIGSVQNIVYIQHAFISVKTRPLFDEKFEAVKVELEGANFMYKTDSSGKSNIDFLMDDNTDESSDTTSTSIPFVNLNQLLLKDITIYYTNDSDLTQAKLHIPKLLISGQFTPEKYTVQSKGNIELSNCNVDSTNIYKMKTLTAGFSINYINDTINVEELEILSDGAELNMYGKVFFGDELYTDLHLKSDGLDLSELIKYAPQELLNENGLKNVSGILSFSGTSKGIVNDSILPHLNFGYAFVDGKLTTTDYPEIKKMDFTGSYTNGNKQSNKTTMVDIRSLHLATKSSSINARFSVKNFDKPTYQLHTNLNVLVDEFKNFVPDSLAQEVSGRFKTTLSTHGTMPDSIDNNFINSALNKTTASVTFDHLFIKTDTLEIHDLSGTMSYSPGKFAVQNLSISVPKESIQLKNTSLNATLTGQLTQASDIGIQLHTFHLESPQGKLWGSGMVNNLEHPSFKLETSALLHLAELKPFLPDTLIRDISGDIGARMNTHGTIHLDSVSEQIIPILMEDSEFHFVIKDLNATLPDTLMQIRNFSGKVDLIPDTISISNMEGRALGIDFSLDSTTIGNYYNTLIQNKPEKLNIRANLSIGAVDHHVFDALLSQTENEKSTVTEKNEEVASVDSSLYSIELKGKFAIKSVNYNNQFIDKVALISELDDSTRNMLHNYLNNNILFENISAKLRYSDSLIIIDDFLLNAFNGQLKSSARLWVQDQHTTIINIKNSIENIDMNVDMKKMLIDFNELGQSGLITSDNICGLLSGTMYTRFLMVDDSVVQDEFYANGTFKLENGGLYNYKPAMAMRKFTGIKELDSIVFKTIETDLFILSNKVFVPKTHMISTAFDASIFGMQNLANDDFEFHTHVNLGDVLTGKNAKLFERQEKDGDIVGKKEKSRGAIKLIYLQEGDNTRTKFDTKKSQNNMDVLIRLQKGLLGVAFNPYLVSFDTGIE